MDVFTQDCLAGRHILVTGASSGLGRETAHLLASKGARLTLLGRDESRLQSVRSALTGVGHRSIASSLCDPEQAAELTKTIAAESGAIDGIFHSAGVELVRPIRLLKNDQAETLFQAALFGALGLAKAVASRGVANDGASLIFMSSVAGLRGTSGMVGYSAAKAAVDGMVRSLACELAPRRIRTNSIAAGAVETEMHGRLTGTLGEQAMLAYERRHPLGFGMPSDISQMVLFLLSDASRWITGTTIPVDGGYTAQ